METTGNAREKVKRGNHIQSIKQVMIGYNQIAGETENSLGKIYNPLEGLVVKGPISGIFDNRIRMMVVAAICLPGAAAYRYALMNDTLEPQDYNTITAQINKAANERRAGSPTTEFLELVYSEAVVNRDYLINISAITEFIGIEDESEIPLYIDDSPNSFGSKVFTDSTRRGFNDEQNGKLLALDYLSTLYARLKYLDINPEMPLEEKERQHKEIKRIVYALAEQRYFYDLEALSIEPVAAVLQQTDMATEPIVPATDVETKVTEAQDSTTEDNLGANEGYIAEDDESHVLLGVPVTISEEEYEILKNAILYDERALGELYDRYANRISSYIYRRIGNEEITNDLTSDVFLKMLEAIRSDTAWKSSYSGWLYRIAHNRVIDFYRQRDRQNLVSLEDSMISTDNDSHPFDYAVRKELADKLRIYLGRLTEEQQEVIEMRFLDGYSISEVVEILSKEGDPKTEGSIKALQYRGTQALRQLMGPEFEEEYNGMKKPNGTSQGRSVQPKKLTSTKDMIADRERRKVEEKEREREELERRRAERRSPGYSPYIKAASNAIHTSMKPGQLPETVSAPAPDVDDNLIEGMDKDIWEPFLTLGKHDGIRKVLDKLPKIAQETLQLRFMEGHNIHEIADIKGRRKELIANDVQNSMKALEKALLMEGFRYSRDILRRILEQGFRMDKIEREADSLKRSEREKEIYESDRVPQGYDSIGSERIAAMFSNLSTLQKRIFLLRSANRKDPQALSDELGITKTQFYDHKRRALELIRGTLSKQGLEYNREQIGDLIEYYIMDSGLADV